MGARVLRLDLAKPCRIPINPAPRQERDGVFVLDVALENEFGTRAQTHSNVGCPDLRKAAGRGFVEFRRHQLVGDLRWTAFDRMQTEIAHSKASFAQTVVVLQSGQPKRRNGSPG